MFTLRSSFGDVGVAGGAAEGPLTRCGGWHCDATEGVVAMADVTDVGWLPVCSAGMPVGPALFLGEPTGLGMGL